MSKRTEFNEALKTAMKGGDQVAVGTLRLINAALKDKDINARGTGKEIGESDILSMLQGMVKQRQESMKIYRDAGREDLAGKEEAEIAVIEKFLPQQMSEADVASVIEKIIKDTGASGVKDMGKIMGVLKAQYAGQIDMGKAGAVVKQKLG
ncbi:MAG: GatB/YqeY domain-containing protein [Alphaproteobacteria bacterium]